MQLFFSSNHEPEAITSQTSIMLKKKEPKRSRGMPQPNILTILNVILRLNTLFWLRNAIINLYIIYIQFIN